LEFITVQGHVQVYIFGKIGFSIFINEEGESGDINTELAQLNGYYVEPEALSDIPAIKAQIQQLKAGTAVMIDMKSIYGGFYYSSSVSDTRSNSVNIQAMDELISYLRRSGMLGLRYI